MCCMHSLQNCSTAWSTHISASHISPQSQGCTWGESRSSGGRRWCSSQWSRWWWRGCPGRCWGCRRWWWGWRTSAAGPSTRETSCSCGSGYCRTDLQQILSHSLKLFVIDSNENLCVRDYRNFLYDLNDDYWFPAFFEMKSTSFSGCTQFFLWVRNRTDKNLNKLVTESE